MAGITYTANARAPLVTDSPAHLAGTSYDMDVKLQGYVENFDVPKQVHVSLGGNVETVLRRASRQMQATLIWPDSQNAQMEEFLLSIAAGETFSLDPYGTIASPVDAQDVICVNSSLNIGRMSHGSSPWRSITLSLRLAA
jgi:hypothetical protein